MCFQANVYSKKAMDTSIWLVLVKKNTFMSPSATVWFIDVSNRLHNGVCGIVDYTKNKDYQLVFWVSPDKVNSTGMSSSSTVTQTTSCLDLSTCLTGVITIHVQSSKKLVRPEKKTFPEVSCSCWIYWKNYFLITELTFQPIHGTDLIRINLTPIAFRTAE